MKKGDLDLRKILKTLRPTHNEGEYVFCVIDDLLKINFNDLILLFKEEEGYTIVVEKKLADRLKLGYSFVAAWICLTVHSSLSSVGLTATFSRAAKMIPVAS